MDEFEFYFKGMPVGLIKAKTMPISTGTFEYEPFLGPGHSEIQQELAREGAAGCYYDTEKGRRFFSVKSRDKGNNLILDDFKLVQLARNGSLEWLEPWVPAVGGMEMELEKEVGVGHLLYQLDCVPVARRIDKDEVLFRIGGPENKVAVVHLIWSGKTESDDQYPKTEIFKSIEAWAENRMKADHRKFMGD